MITTPTITATLAELCVVLRAYGLAHLAGWIESEQDNGAHLMTSLTDAESGLRNVSRLVRWEHRGVDRDAALSSAFTCDKAALAAQWLGSAVRTANGYGDTRDADRQANRAAELLDYSTTLASPS
jgi:hypothetical protein